MPLLAGGLAFLKESWRSLLSRFTRRTQDFMVGAMVVMVYAIEQEADAIEANGSGPSTGWRVVRGLLPSPESKRSELLYVGSTTGLDPHPDGKHFVVAKAILPDSAEVEALRTPEMTMVVNWRAELERRMGRTDE